MLTADCCNEEQGRQRRRTFNRLWMHSLQNAWKHWVMTQSRSFWLHTWHLSLVCTAPPGTRKMSRPAPPADTDNRQHTLRNRFSASRPDALVGALCCNKQAHKHATPSLDHTRGRSQLKPTDRFHSLIQLAPHADELLLGF
jgi:hypothetical protein